MVVAGGVEEEAVNDVIDRLQLLVVRLVVNG